MPTASSRYFRSWSGCGLNKDMALWAGFDPKLTFAVMHIRGHEGVRRIVIYCGFAGLSGASDTQA
jgi:hypothetical protein